MNRNYNRRYNYDYDSSLTEENEMSVKSHLDGITSEIEEMIDPASSDEERYDQTIMICLLNLAAAVIQLSENVRRIADSIDARW